MKHNFMTKMVSALLAVVLSTAAFSITAFASGGEESTESVTEQETVGDVSDLLSALAGSQVTVSVTEDGIQFSSGENDSGQTGTVTTGGGNLNVRTGAGMDYTAFTQIPNGTTVKVIGTDGDWLKVILPEKVGYVYSGYMTVSDGEAGSGEGSFSLDTETLENLLESWEQGRKELEEKQGAYQREIKKRDALRETYQAMESLFLDAQAGILAEKLTEGEPCPVCGAIHHPQPARRAEHTPDKETLDHKKEELRMQEEAAAGQSEAAGSCRRQVKEKRAQLTEWLLRELPESQKEHEQKRLSQMPDVLFQQEAVEKAEQLRKEEETQKVRQMEYAELEKDRQNGRKDWKA